MKKIEESNLLSMKIVEDAEDYLFKQNVSMTNAIFMKRTELTEQIVKMEREAIKLDSEVVLLLGIILDGKDRIADYGCNIGEIAINSSASWYT